jgi:hypothetical protein
MINKNKSNMYSSTPEKNSITSNKPPAKSKIISKNSKNKNKCYKHKPIKWNPQSPDKKNNSKTSKLN